MKHFILYITLLICPGSILAEGINNYSGEFKGQEVFDMKCTNPSLNNNGTRDWHTVHNEIEGGKYKAVINSDGIAYNAIGIINNNSAYGEFEGKDASGNDCNGQFTNTLIGDTLQMNILGSCPKINCNFTSDITATRQVNKE